MTNASLRPSVLVVDDESLIRWVLGETLKRRFDVRAAGTVSEARALIHQGDRLPADVALLDLQLADGSGLELLAEIKRSWPACHVFILTAFARSDLASSALASGAAGILHKPFDLEAIVTLLSRHAPARRDPVRPARPDAL
jgi:DNA-binding NtrC family response regulator